MNWDAIIKAYPENRKNILRAKDLNEKINKIIGTAEIPVIQSPLDGIPDAIISDLISLCTRLWISVFEKSPEWDIKKTVRDCLSNGYRDLPDIEDEDVKIFLSSSIKKYFHLLKEKNQVMLPKQWAKGICPFCSTHPRIAFDSEQARTLFCPLCGHSWEFQRIRCTLCNNMDHTMLGYFEAEGIAGVRVSFCNMCKHYIKVIDTRMRPVNDPDTEDVLTFGLNDLATQEGFKD